MRLPVKAAMAVAALFFVCAAADARAGEPASQPAVTGATYLRVPVRGVIGRDFHSEILKQYMAQAARFKPTVVLLDVDTPGGSVTDAERIVDLIISDPNTRYVALVHRALSAGATITMACKEIYVTEGATFGAAVSFTPDKDGKPENIPADVAEKFQSAWRAVCRKSAEFGGHSALLAEAMADPDFSLTLRHQDDKAIVERDGKGELFKAKGRILTMTAKEAVACEMARGIAADAKAVGVALGMGTWIDAHKAHPLEDTGTTLETSPQKMYELLTAKATALKLADTSLTDLQVETAVKDFDTFVTQQRLIGKKVQWSGLLMGAERAERADGNVAANIRTGFPLRVGINAGRDYDVAIVAWVNKNLVDAVGKISAGGDICIQGTITKVQFAHTRGKKTLATTGEGDLFLWVEIDQATLPNSSSASASPLPAGTGSSEETPQQAAQKKLDLARLYRTGGNATMVDKARELYRSIIRDYPDTPAAQKAKTDLAEMK